MLVEATDEGARGPPIGDAGSEGVLPSVDRIFLDLPCFIQVFLVDRVQAM